MICDDAGGEEGQGSWQAQVAQRHKVLLHRSLEAPSRHLLSEVLDVELAQEFEGPWHADERDSRLRLAHHADLKRPLARLLRIHHDLEAGGLQEALKLGCPRPKHSSGGAPLNMHLAAGL